MTQEQILEVASIEELMEQAYQADEPHGFVIDDDKKACWALRKIKREREQHAAFVTCAQERIDQLQAIIDQIRERVDASASETSHGEVYFTGLLAQYFESVPDARKRAAKTQSSLKLPEGKIIMKFPGRDYAHDDDKLLAALDAANLTDLIRVKRVPAWSDVKKLLTTDADGTVRVLDAETGELVAVDGVTAITTPGAFKVEV